MKRDDMVYLSYSRDACDQNTARYWKMRFVNMGFQRGERTIRPLNTFV